MRVSHSRPGAAAVTDGTRIGAGAFRSDAKSAAAIEASERTAARADGVNVEHGNGDGQAGDFGFVRGAQRAVDEGDIRGRAAHVEGNNFSEAARDRKSVV